MFFGLAYYAKIEHEGFHIFRNKYEPYASLLPEHISFIYPVPESIGQNQLETHIRQVLAKWRPFDVHISGFQKTWDHWLMLVLKEGNSEALRLHDELYTSILSTYLRKDLPHIPHVGLGLFSKEKYDFNNPTAQLTLDEEKYQHALSEAEQLGLDFWKTIDCLTLVKINSNYSECWDVKEFQLIWI